MPYPSTTLYPGLNVFPGLGRVFTKTGTGKVDFSIGSGGKIVSPGGVGNLYVKSGAGISDRSFHGGRRVATFVRTGLGKTDFSIGSGVRAGVVALSGQSDGSTIFDSANGTIPVRRPLSSSIGAGSTISANATVLYAMSASPAGSTVLTGNARAAYAMQAALAGSTLVIASPNTVDLTGSTIQGTTTVTGTMSIPNQKFLTFISDGITTVYGWLSVPDFPTSVSQRPANILPGLTILADHVGNLWDEVVSIESELKGVGSGALTLDMRPAAAGNIIFQSSQRTGDSQSRFQLTANGKHSWGPGTALVDVVLDRVTTRTLRLSGSYQVFGANAADVPLNVTGSTSQTADYLSVTTSAASYVLRLNSAGQLLVPTNGNLAGIQIGSDTQLYRSQLNSLRSTADLEFGGPTGPRIVGDTSYRAQAYSAASIPALRVSLGTDTSDRLQITSDGQILFGNGSGSQDASIARTASNQLTLSALNVRFTSDVQVVGVLTVSGNSSFIVSPVSVTPAQDDNSTKMATTAFVLGQASGVAPLMNSTVSSGVSFRYSREDHVHPVDTSRAPLASPAFTGTPLAPTPPTGDNTTRLATTQFVQNTAFAAVSGNLSNATPRMNGAAQSGSSTLASRDDHIHPVDTSRAPIANPTFQGQSLFPLGSNSLPSISFTGDTDTGIYSASANQFSLVTNALPTLTVANFQALFQSGQASNPSIAFQSQPSTGFAMTGTPSVPIVGISVSAVEQARVEGSGIMTLSPANSAGGLNGILRIGLGGPQLYRITSTRAFFADADYFQSNDIRTVNTFTSGGTTTLAGATTANGLITTSGTSGVLVGVGGPQLVSNSAATYTSNATLSVLASDLEIRRTTGGSRLVLFRPDGTRRVLRIDNNDNIVVEAYIAP